MRKLLVAAFTAGLLGLCVYLQAQAPKKEEGAVKIRVRLRRRTGTRLSETGQPLRYRKLRRIEVARQHRDVTKKTPVSQARTIDRGQAAH